MKICKQLIIIAFLIIANTATADELFRSYRYEGFRLLPECEEGDIVFIGNSITNMFNWYEAFGSQQNIHGRGTSGGYTQEILDNLHNMISGRPSKVFLMIGTNDLGTQGEQYAPERVAERITRILSRIRTEAPTAEVYYESILPSTVGIRTQEKTERTNAIVRQWIENQGDNKLTYIDLYSLFVNSDGFLTNKDKDADALSFDGLHLTQKGYRIWTSLIEKYVGKKTLLPVAKANDCGGVGGSTGMRYTYFNALPVKRTDILFFGDDMVHNVEWHELLGSADIKDRGAGWGKNSLSIETMMQSLEPALKGKPSPRAICVLVGMTDLSWGSRICDVWSRYYAAIEKLQSLAPGTPVFLVNLMPAAADNAGLNDRIRMLNDALAVKAQLDANIHLVDIHSSMLGNDSKRREELFLRPDEHLPNAQGNALIAQLLAEKLNEVLGTKYGKK